MGRRTAKRRRCSEYLGGRERKTGGSAERARIDIQRRISDAVRKLEEACPPLGRRLSRALRTGACCAYEE